MTRKVPSFWILLLVLVGVSLWASPLRAQRVYIDINQPSFEQMPVAIPEFKRQNEQQPRYAGELSGMLGNALDSSGIFRILDPRGFLGDPQGIGVELNTIRFDDWRRLGADFLVRGQYRVEGDQLALEMRLFDAVAGRTVVGKLYTGSQGERRRMIQRFADEILFAITGERGNFGTRIAFVQQQGKDREIYLVDFDGSNPVPLTQDHGINLSPAWHPSGNKIVYVGFQGRHTKLFAIDVGSGSRRVLAEYPGLNAAAAWRPGHGELAATLSMGGNPDIYLLNESGGVVRQLTKGWSIEVSPCWSPDGNRLAYVSSETGNPQVYVLEVAGGSSRRITFQGTYNTDPAWSPKGDLIAYTGQAHGAFQIFVIRPDGSGNRQLTSGAGNNESPTWSPDGRLIAFSSDREGSRAIWVTVVNGQGLRRLTHLGGEQRMPDWSPRTTEK